MFGVHAHMCTCATVCSWLMRTCGSQFSKVLGIELRSSCLQWAPVPTQPDPEHWSPGLHFSSGGLQVCTTAAGLYSTRAPIRSWWMLSQHSTPWAIHPPGQPSILSSLGVEPWDHQVGLCSTGRSAPKLLSTAVHPSYTRQHQCARLSVSWSSPTLWLYVWTLTFFRIAFLISVIWYLSVSRGELFVDRILSHR